MGSGYNSLESIPGLHKSFKNTASVRFTSIQFIFFASILPISGISRVCSASIFLNLWNKQTSLRFVFSNLWNKQTSLRFDLSNLWYKQILLRFDLLNLWNKQNSLRFALSKVQNKQGSHRFDLYKFWNKQVRFSSISKTKSRSKLCSAFVSISLPLLLATTLC
jgi:hypothetical protein